MFRTFLVLLICTTSWSQTIRGIYTHNPLKSLGDATELSDLAKTSTYFSYIYSNNVSLQQLQSVNLKTVDTTYTEAYGQIFQKTETVNRASNVTHYKNYNEDIYRLDFSQNNKDVSIRDGIPQYSWKLAEGTKTVAGYSCKKATATITKVGRKQNIVAWYCEEIPINDGLVDFSGLPGLILELEIGDLTRISFEKIVIDPKENTDIPEPTKNTNSITIKEYETMILGNR